jgi:hypothetical protein
MGYRDPAGKSIFSLIAIGMLFSSPAPANDFLRSLPADSWYQAPDSKMRPVCASETGFPTIRAVGGCAMVMEGWSGGAYDAGRKRMWIWGGGHADYYGNELYAFDVETLKWSRVTDPSPVAQDKLSADPMPDGSPVSRHTYDGLAFLGPMDRLFAFGGSMGGNGYGTPVTWLFDPVAGKWTDRKPSGDANRPQTNCCNFSAEFDPATRKVFMRDPNWLCVYDYDSNSWSHAREWYHDWGPGKAVIDSKRHLYFTIGSGEFLAYDIGADKDATSEWKTSGGDSIIGGYGAGAAYDSKSDKIVAWQGGGAFVLDMQTKNWTRKSSTGAPAGQLTNGTFGRFRYIPDDNVFMLVNGVDSDVFFYKLTAGAGSTALSRHRAEKGAVRKAVPGPAGIKPARGVDGRKRNYRGDAPFNHGLRIPDETP